MTDSATPQPPMSVLEQLEDHIKDSAAASHKLGSFSCKRQSTFEIPLKPASRSAMSCSDFCVARAVEINAANHIAKQAA